MWIRVRWVIEFETPLLRGITLARLYDQKIGHIFKKLSMSCSRNRKVVDKIIFRDYALIFSCFFTPELETPEPT